MKIKVWNDGKQVFEGESEQFIKDNQDDPDVIDMVNDGILGGIVEREFFSGDWTVKLLEEVKDIKIRELLLGHLYKLQDQEWILQNIRETQKEEEMDKALYKKTQTKIAMLRNFIYEIINVINHEMIYDWRIATDHGQGNGLPDMTVEDQYRSLRTWIINRREL